MDSFKLTTPDLQVCNTVAHKSRKFKLTTERKPDHVLKEVDVLVIGGGPAALGLLVNAFKTNR